MGKKLYSFNKQKAQQHLEKLLIQHNIKHVKWSVTSCGWADIKYRAIKIPHPISVDRFCVGMHEIKHILDGKKGNLYQREYNCEIFAIQQAKLLNFDTSKYEERARRYIIMNIAKGHCRGLKLHTIPQEIKDFCNIDFREWIDKKVFVIGWSNIKKPLEIKFY